MRSGPIESRTCAEAVFTPEHVFTGARAGAVAAGGPELLRKADRELGGRRPLSRRRGPSQTRARE